MLPSTSQEKPFAVTTLLNPQNSNVQVIAARYINGGKPQVHLGGNFDIDEICTVGREMLERADIPQSSPYYPVLQAIQNLQSGGVWQQQGSQGQQTQQGQSRQQQQGQDWKNGPQQQAR